MIALRNDLILSFWDRNASKQACRNLSACFDVVVLAGASGLGGIAGFTVRRGLCEGTYALADVAVGLENSPALHALFGGLENSRQLVSGMRLNLRRMRGYMYVDDRDGSLVASLDYVNKGDERDLYLDFVHELAHIKQLREGRELFDRKTEYAESPIEIEAYRVVVNECLRLGLAWKEIRDYIYMDWLEPEEFARLLRNIGVPVSD